MCNTQRQDKVVDKQDNKANQNSSILHLLIAVTHGDRGGLSFQGCAQILQTASCNNWQHISAKTTKITRAHFSVLRI